MFTYLHVVLATHLPLLVVWLLDIKAREGKILETGIGKTNLYRLQQIKICILNYLHFESHSTRLIKNGINFQSGLK